MRITVAADHIGYAAQHKGVHLRLFHPNGCLAPPIGRTPVQARQLFRAALAQAARGALLQTPPRYQRRMQPVGVT